MPPFCRLCAHEHFNNQPHQWTGDDIPPVPPEWDDPPPRERRSRMGDPSKRAQLSSSPSVAAEVIDPKAETPETDTASHAPANRVSPALPATEGEQHAVTPPKRGHPRRYASNAERQAAYRARRPRKATDSGTA